MITYPGDLFWYSSYCRVKQIVLSQGIEAFRELNFSLDGNLLHHYFVLGLINLIMICPFVLI